MGQLEVYLRKRAPIMDLYHDLSSLGRVFVDKNRLVIELDSDSQLSICPAGEIATHEVPAVDSRCLARCFWRLVIQFSDSQPTKDAAYKIGCDLAREFGGGVYDSAAEKLVYPETAPLIVDTNKAWPPWSELHQAFNDDGAMEQIYVPLTHEPDWNVINEEANACGFAVHREQGADFAKAVYLDVDPRQIEVFKDGLVILELMRVLATRLATSVHLVPHGSNDDKLITINQDGSLVFFKSNCPVPFV